MAEPRVAVPPPESEEYRIAGTFPGMINRVIYHNSDMPDRYPLNSNTAMLINVAVGWGAYLLAVPRALRVFFLLCKEKIATPAYFYTGIPLGIILNIAGILKMIDWLKDRNTTYVYETRNLLPQDRKQKS